MSDTQGKWRAKWGKRHLKEVVENLIQRFRSSKYNLIQRKRDSIKAYQDLRDRQVSGYLANPRRNSRWGTPIPQVIVEEPTLSRNSPAENQPHSLRRQHGAENLRLGPARFVEAFSPPLSLLERSGPRPARFQPQNRLSLSPPDRQDAASSSKHLVVPDSLVPDRILSYDHSDLQQALSASRPLTDADEYALDDLYFQITEHLHEPAVENEPVPPGRMFPLPRRRPDSPYPGYYYPEPTSTASSSLDGSYLNPAYPESTYPERSQSRAAGGAFGGEMSGPNNMIDARETLYRPMSDTSRTGPLFRIDSSGEFVSMDPPEEQEEVEEFVEETATERKVRLGAPGWI
ncbi:hypothetical protein IFR05_007697 [Cadophora sp. M221]|nr:hypothetical protein IFR05_007697 [Cadophora sp. M221]